MRKRFITTFIISIISIVCVLCFAACGDKTVEVSGKTYVFETIYCEPEGASGIDYADTIEAYANKLKMNFADDGTVTQVLEGETILSGTYTQEGDKVVINDDGELSYLEVSGNKLIMTHTYEDEKTPFKQVQIFKLIED